MQNDVFNDWRDDLVLSFRIWVTQNGYAKYKKFDDARHAEFGGDERTWMNTWLNMMTAVNRGFEAADGTVFQPVDKINAVDQHGFVYMITFPDADYTDPDKPVIVSVDYGQKFVFAGASITDDKQSFHAKPVLIK